MRAAWHLWVIGLATLLWHAGGAYDYVMTESRNAAYLAMLPEARRADVLAYVDTMPVWATAAWAFAVWGAVAGSLLLLLRSRFAGSAFGTALIGFAVTQYYTFRLAPVSSVTRMDPAALLFTAAIGAVLLLVLIYARAQTRAGVLR